MNRPSRVGTALSTIAIAATLSGCAIGHESRQSIFGGKVDKANIGLATRAQVALASQQYATAIELAERAVENAPNDAGFRALLGNCYFASGRFASAESAFRDSLTLIPAQPELILKLALVQIAQGKNARALAELEAARYALDAADYGLALALAGQPEHAVTVLDEAARMPGADSRLRQNLALSYALSGDWAMARTVAAQDVPPAQLDDRIQQWMAMATPQHASDQVAALTGVTPAADPGQPERLALNRAAPEAPALAQVEIPQSQPRPQVPTQPVAEIPATPPVAMPEPMPVSAPAVAVAAPVVETPDPVVADAAQSLLEAPVVADAAQSLLEAPVEAAIEAPGAIEAPVVKAVASAPELPTKFEAEPTPAYVAITETVRSAADHPDRAKGRSSSVVQLGAYSSPDRVAVAWDLLTKRYPALAEYTPMRARFDGPKGTVWRLSIRGFGDQREAIARCEALQSRGGKCFVRLVAGDSPVQFASR